MLEPLRCNTGAHLRARNRDQNSIVMETMAGSRTKNLAIACSDSGTGEPVLLLHCTLSSSAEWESLSDTLDEDFRVIAPDQWGCGKSDPWTGQGEFNLAQEAAPILDIIDRVGAAVHLIGHSYGGGVALWVARQHPDLIRSLTLIEPSAFHFLRDGALDNRTLFREIFSVADMVREAILSGDYCGGMGRFVDYWNGEGAWNAMSQKARMKFCKNLSKVVLDFHALFEEPARLKDYAALSIPTLLLCGDRSPAPSCRIVEMLASTMPHARVVQIQGAAHMSPFTHSDAVNAAIGAHLRQYRVATTHWAADSALHRSGEPRWAEQSPSCMV
jgi:pimeloyl-ACP methyl ester carboxylesterase